MQAVARNYLSIRWSNIALQSRIDTTAPIAVPNQTLSVAVVLLQLRDRINRVPGRRLVYHGYYVASGSGAVDVCRMNSSDITVNSCVSVDRVALAIHVYFHLDEYPGYCTRGAPVVSRVPM
jgi:hypothetical protein